MLILVNQARASNGNLPPLCENAKLNAAAQLHSNYQAANKIMTHNEPAPLTNPQDRMQAQGFNWQAAAENVAYGQTTESQVMIAWMNSAGHRANILGSYVYFGSGYTLDNTGSAYWTQDFGSDGSSC